MQENWLLRSGPALARSALPGTTYEYEACDNRIHDLSFATSPTAGCVLLHTINFGIKKRFSTTSCAQDTQVVPLQRDAITTELLQQVSADLTSDENETKSHPHIMREGNFSQPRAYHLQMIYISSISAL